MKSLHKYLFVLSLLIWSACLFSACRKHYLPSTEMEEQNALSNLSDIQTATIGCYAKIKSENYVRSGHFLMEYPSDEVAQGQNSSDDLTNIYKYTHLVNSKHAAYFWAESYKTIGATNKIIAHIPDGSEADLLQLKGENLFLRALIHFNLLRMFGRPYNQQNGQNLGVMILKEGLSTYEQEHIARSNVKEVYEFIIQDLIKSSEFLNKPKSNAFASKEVAYALLSRVYLYMGNFNQAIAYANKVIESGRYELLQGDNYEKYFRGVPESNKETIFCIRHTKVENRGMNSLGSMYYSGDGMGNAQNQAITGWGEIYASEKYINFLNQHPQDRRWSFISPFRYPSGEMRKNNKLIPPAPIYYVNKYNFQEGDINLCSPVYLRLAEMYLNRAEAYAQLGQDDLAIEDVNRIRTRANIPNYTLADIQNSGKNMLDIVLEERWLELAFEGQRVYDLFRNNKAMIRNYPGTHALNGDVNQRVNAQDARVIFFIPLIEISRNPALVQNP